MTRPHDPPSTAALPGWLKPVNKIIVRLQRLGLSIGAIRTISVPGRHSGKLRVTPVAPFTVDGQDYVVGRFLDADWVRNAQAAGWAVVAKGRRRRRVRVVELPETERGPILREFPVKVPHGVQFFVKTGVVESGTPEEFEAIADRSIVFRLDPA